MSATPLNPYDHTTLDLVSELLPGAPSVGACAMGMATMALAQHGLRPTRAILEKMLDASSLEEARIAIDRHLARRGAIRNQG